MPLSTRVDQSVQRPRGKQRGGDGKTSSRILFPPAMSYSRVHCFCLMMCPHYYELYPPCRFTMPCGSYRICLARGLCQKYAGSDSGVGQLSWHSRSLLCLELSTIKIQRRVSPVFGSSKSKKTATFAIPGSSSPFSFRDRASGSRDYGSVALAGFIPRYEGLSAQTKAPFSDFM